MGECASGFSSALPSRVAAIVHFTDVERPAIQNRARPLGRRLRTQGRDYLISAETSDNSSGRHDSHDSLVIATIEAAIWAAVAAPKFH